MNHKTDWNILLQGYLSLLWCQKSCEPKNGNKKLSDFLTDFQRENEDIKPLNIGTMLSAAYLCFMYPQQTEFDTFDFEKIDVKDFKIIKGKTRDTKHLCRRIRNSLAHARFTVDSIKFTFQDWKLDKNNITDEFEVTIDIGGFGEFLNNFFFAAKSNSFGLKQ